MVTPAPVDASEIASQVQGLLGTNFSVENLVAIIAVSLGLTVGLVLFHFAYKWIKGKVMSALKRGRL